jgi:hypothetical protein
LKSKLGQKADGVLSQFAIAMLFNLMSTNCGHGMSGIAIVAPKYHF